MKRIDHFEISDTDTIDDDDEKPSTLTKQVLEDGDDVTIRNSQIQEDCILSHVVIVLDVNGEDKGDEDRHDDEASTVVIAEPSACTTEKETVIILEDDKEENQIYHASSDTTPQKLDDKRRTLHTGTRSKLAVAKRMGSGMITKPTVIKRSLGSTADKPTATRI
ncbi:hypothetical protein BDB00DRAFT_930960 [Zychaea mexicana]|uniref:uncharacterized protein n=1 Tax=Zychaea mexicana TaxID=64656 RepID=UPI0022FE0FEE|nr:uncharacterized protein BDB00DRAFT_930960 [Zychaea mexicana]KAI9490821.1 hypothetical protein BDB00DRAFT_930960 [Zychaea mexicana]